MMQIKKRYLTGRGFLLFGVTLAMLFSAINFQRNALFWAGYGVLSMLIMGVSASVLLCRPQQLRWQWHMPAWCFSNRPVHINGAWATTLAAPHVIWTSPAASCMPFEQSFSEPGQVTLPRLEGYTEYPLGLVKTKMYFTPTESLWVYPAPINHRTATPTARYQDDEATLLRSYQAGDTPNRILRKTQALPEASWLTRTADVGLRGATSAALKWSDLPAQWSTLKKAEQLSYEVSQVPTDKSFTLTLPDGSSHQGFGISHQHRCWQLLTFACSGKGAS